MVRLTSVYVCQQCGFESGKWAGKCPQCGEWNTLVEEAVERSSKKSSSGRTSRTSSSGEKTDLVSLSSVKKKEIERISTKIGELNRVLGGGIVPGQAILIAGEPGIGKSTILLQLSDKLEDVVYVSGEESIQQLKLRAERLGINKRSIRLMEDIDIDVIIETLNAEKSGTFPKALIIDSIQTMQTTDLSGMAGSVGQVRECASRLVRFAKTNKIPVFIVGHVTKQGSIAGPAVLMHIVDTVLWFEGDKQHNLRLLRAHKNRFGSTEEVGIFEMEDKGLNEVSNPQKLFLSDKRKNESGVCVTSVMKGTRPILVEIQTLLVTSNMAYPRRVAQGIDSKRLELLLAVLTKKTGLNMFNYDCFVNVTGGISVKNDPSTDLAIALSIASSYFDKPLKSSTVAIGELGLTGEIRPVTMQDNRIKEAKRLGYANIISSKTDKYLQSVIKKLLK